MHTLTSVEAEALVKLQGDTVAGVEAYTVVDTLKLTHWSIRSHTRFHKSRTRVLPMH